MPTYTFSTITTGKSEKLSTDLSADEMDLLRPLVRAKGGAIPGQPAYRCVITPVDGGAMFTVKRGELMLAFCGVACTPRAAEEVWSRLQESHLASYEAMIAVLGFQTPDSWLTMPNQPGELPWVGASQQPGLGQDPGAADWLGGFEVALGQALLLDAMGRKYA